MYVQDEHFSHGW